MGKPKLSDDRLPMLMVILDGLGDRASADLDGRTPCEAANTPVMDALARRGVSGWHIPFGPGRSTSSERAHWALFGFENVPFPGRAAIEALGVGEQPPASTPLFHLALRHGSPKGDGLYLGARARPGTDETVAAELFAALGGRSRDEVSFDILPLRTGESILVANGATTRDVSDTDALFDHLHPWMRPRALDDAQDPAAAEHFAADLQHWLLESREILLAHPLNAARRSDGLPTLDTAVTKWASWIDPHMPTFEQRVGTRGGAVTDTALYRGLAQVLGMRWVDLAFDARAMAEDMHGRLTHARELLDSCGFVHVHVKSTDEAGHRKDPAFKRDVIAATDEGLTALLELSEHAIVTVTGDHATPSVGGLLHSGDPTPLVVAGPGVRADGVTSFGESAARDGDLGRLCAADVLPLMAGYGNRPAFLGHRPGPWNSIAMPDRPEPMPLNKLET